MWTIVLIYYLRVTRMVSGLIAQAREIIHY